MSEEALRHFGGKSEVMNDLYSLKQLLFDSEVEPKVYYLEAIEGAFQRPSFLIKIVGWNLVPRNDAVSWNDTNFLIQYFSEDLYDAQHTAAQVQDLLSRRTNGQKDLILPRYDFDASPPRPIPINYRDPDNNEAIPSLMGTRIDPTSISLAPTQEDDSRWNVAITFNGLSPRLPVRPPQPVIKDVIPTRIGPPFITRTQIVEAGVNSTVETDSEK